MTTKVRRPTVRSRLPSWGGPETVAAILSVIVLGVLVLVASPLGPLAPGPGASPSPTFAASSARASREPVASPIASPVSWATTARAIHTIDERLLASADDLTKILAASTVSTSDIVRELRAMSSTLATANGLIDSLEGAGAPADLVADLAGAHQTTFDEVAATLEASVQNRAAYRAGARDVIASMEPYATLMERLAEAGGVAVPSPAD